MLFKTFSNLLNNAQRVAFLIEKQADGSLKVLVTPHMKVSDDEDKDLEGEQAELRAALTIPLMVTATAEQLDNEFPACLTKYVNQRTALSSNMAALDALTTANAKANKAISGKSTKKPAAGKGAVTADDADDDDSDSAPAGSTLPPPTSPGSVVTAENPGSLF